MMAELPSLSCVPAAIRDEPRYVGDHVIRHYQSRHISELAADLGTDLPDPFEVVGGIGVLVMTANGNTFTPAIRDLPAIAARPPVTEDQAEARRAVCRACPMLDGDKCRMCGCAGQISQRATSPWASCPKGMWPDLPSWIGR
jgi:hypothetical protein